MALAASIYNDHQLSIEKYVGTLASKPDYATKGGVIYSDRLPGNAFLIVPFIAYADFVSYLIPDDWIGNRSYDITPSALFPFVKNGVSSNFDILVSTLLPNICGVLALYLLFLICRNYFSFSFRLSILVMLIGGYCTLNHLESTHLFSHAPSMLLLTLAVAISLFSKNAANYKVHLYAMSAIMGLATIIELQNILFIIPLFLYTIQINELKYSKDLLEIIKTLSVSLLIISLFVSGLLCYNYLAFDELMLKSNKYNLFFPEEKSFFSALSGNPIKGLDSLFTSFLSINSYFDWSSSTGNSTPGLITSNPVFIFSILGFIPFYKQKRKECLLFISLIIISVLIAAFHVTTLVRHIFTIHLVLFLPLIFFIDSLRLLNPKKRKVIYLLVLATISYSFFRQIYLTNHYFRDYEMGEFPFLENIFIFFILNIPLILWIVFKSKGLLKINKTFSFISKYN